MILLVLFSACKKDIGRPPKENIKLEEPLVYPCNCEDTALVRTIFPPLPGGMEYDYYQTRGGKSIWRVLPDPDSSNIIYYLTSEDVSHVLWRLNLSTGEKKYLATGVMNDWDIHPNGWIVFDTFDWNVYKIKTNGDSLTKLTNDNVSMMPKWSTDGKYIWVVRSGGGLRQIKANGEVVQELFNVHSPILQCGDLIYFVRLENKVFSIEERNLLTGAQHSIYQGEEGINDFELNEDHSEMCWWNTVHLYRSNIITGKKEALIESKNRFYFFKRSTVTKRYYSVLFTISAYNPITLMQTSELYEFSADGKCMRKIKLPD